MGCRLNRWDRQRLPAAGAGTHLPFFPRWLSNLLSNSLAAARKVKAGARIRTADLLITNLTRTSSEVQLIRGFRCTIQRLRRSRFRWLSTKCGDFRCPTDTSTDTRFFVLSGEPGRRGARQRGCDRARLTSCLLAHKVPRSHDRHSNVGETQHGRGIGEGVSDSCSDRR